MSELDELEARARRQAEADAKRRGEELSQQARARLAESDRREREEREGQKAPVGAWEELRARVVFSAMILGAATIVLGVLYEGDGAVLGWLGPAWGLWGALVGMFLLVRSRWRSRLGYRLDGFDRIGGRAPEGADRAPIVAFVVEVSLHEHAGEAPRRAVGAALSLLASEANRKLSSDTDYSDCVRWQAGERRAEGEGSFAFYRSGLLRRWLSGPMKKAARVGGVAGVSVTATYTTKSFWIDTSID